MVRFRILADPHHRCFHYAVRIASRSRGDIVRHERVHHDEMRGELRDVLSTIDSPSNPHVRRNKKHTTEITSSVDIAISIPHSPSPRFPTPNPVELQGIRSSDRGIDEIANIRKHSLPRADENEGRRDFGTVNEHFAKLVEG